MVEDKSSLRQDSSPEGEIQASKVDQRLFADLMRPLKKELGGGLVAVARKITDFDLYKKLLDVKQAAREVRQGDYTEAVGRLIKRGALDAVQAVGIGLFWLAADRIYSEEGARFLGRIGFPGEACDLVTGLARVLERSGQKQTVIASAVLMKFLRDSGRQPQEGRTSDTELYLRYGRQRVVAFFSRVLPESFRRRN